MARRLDAADSRTLLDCVICGSAPMIASVLRIAPPSLLDPCSVTSTLQAFSRQSMPTSGDALGIRPPWVVDEHLPVEDSALAAEAFQDRQDALDIAGTLSRGLGLGVTAAQGDDSVADDLIQRLWGDTVVEYENAVFVPRASLLHLFHTALRSRDQPHRDNRPEMLGGGGDGIRGANDDERRSGSATQRPAAGSVDGVLALSHFRLLASAQPQLCEATIVALDASMSGYVEAAWFRAARAGRVASAPGCAALSSGFLDGYVDDLWALVTTPPSPPPRVHTSVLVPPLAAIAGGGGGGGGGDIQATAATALFNVLVGLGKTADALLLCDVLIRDNLSPVARGGKQQYLQHTKSMAPLVPIRYVRSSRRVGWVCQAGLSDCTERASHEWMDGSID